ncbi:MAG: pyruvate kinase [bacterium]
MRKTKIISTLGPASFDERVIYSLANAGVDIFRLNFSHGDYAFHSSCYNKIKKIERRLKCAIGIMADLAGIKIRIGRLAGGKITLKDGSFIKIVKKNIVGDEGKISLNYPDIVPGLKIGQSINIDDDKIELKVFKKDKDGVRVKVIRGGELGERKGVQIPGLRIKMPSITAKDKADLKFGIKLGIDFVAHSFVRTADDVMQVKRFIKRQTKKRIPVIAKIESGEGIKNIEAIIAAADGIMIARGDMGVFIDRAEVPFVQKMIIDKCNQAGKPVITATDMLDSMIRNPHPTRAEVTDVSEAILHGSDCVMLSGETAAGKYPVSAVAEMSHIAEVTECSINYDEYLALHHVSLGHSVPEALGYSARELAELVEAKAIMTFTLSGKTAEIVSRYRPNATIIAVTPVKETERRLLPFWGIHSIASDHNHNLEQLFDTSIRVAVAKRLVKKGDRVVLVGGGRERLGGETNFIKVLKA